MKQRKKNVAGVTLLEIMLVLVIASGIIMLGLKQYNSMRVYGNAAQVQGNVDNLFQAAAFYYHANCQRQIDPVTMNQVNAAGTLDPDYIDPVTTLPAPPSNPYPVPITTLLSAGYLPASPIANAMINDSSANSYIIQFNQETPAPDRILNTPTGPVKLGKIINYTIQIAVELKDPKKANVYQKLLNAECLSRLIGTVVMPCSSAWWVPPVGGVIYAVWERQPSFAVPNSQSDLWQTNMVNKEFNQFYTTKPVSYLGSLPAASYSQQNYLCGS